MFDDDAALALQKAEIEIALKASSLDWSEIDPSILGMLFERGLDPEKRAQLGAHYTDRDKIMLIVEPVLVRPLLAEWQAVKAQIAALLSVRRRRGREQHRRGTEGEPSGCWPSFLSGCAASPCLIRLRLRELPLSRAPCAQGPGAPRTAGGRGDGLQRTFPLVSPANVKGIEINAYAAELARVSVWIGEIQWMRRNGFAGSRDPILEPLETIECRDAI